MSWIHGSITLDDGSLYSGHFFVKEDGQLGEVFRPDVNDNDINEDEELLSKAANSRSPYQYPAE